MKRAELKQYNGGCSDYLEKVESSPSEKIVDKPTIKLQKSKSSNNSKLKFSFNEQREYATIENDIATLEKELSLTEEKIGKYYSDYEKLAQLVEKKAMLEADLSFKMERWAYLNDLSEKVEANH